MTAPTTDTEIRPQEGPQEAFLSTSADIAIYGGAAGGGKTWGLLLEPLRHINNSEFGAVIFRRTYPQITNEGGMWDEASKLYPLLGAEPNLTDLFWRFKSGARVKFAHLQYEPSVYDWQGSQISLIGFDELTHFTEKQFFYMLSRNRSMSGVRPYVRATCNPDVESWVAEFIAWWVDQDTGYAIPERAGKVRWFVRINDVLVWADSAEELAQYAPIPPKSVTFIPASVHDNKLLLSTNPEYLANLYALSFVERERLLGGNWKVKPAAGKVFNREWFEIVDTVPAQGEDCRFWDLAASEKKMTKKDPDYTSSTLMRKVGGIYYVLDNFEVQEGPAEVDRKLLNISKQDATKDMYQHVPYRVRWEEEGGASGKRDSARLVEMLAPLDVAPVRPQGDKLTRAKGLAAQALAGNVKLLRGPWNDRWLTHMHNQPDWPHDDTMDSSSGAFNELAEGFETDEDVVDDLMEYSWR